VDNDVRLDFNTLIAKFVSINWYISILYLRMMITWITFD
jgi:hypothetical protein